VAGQDTDDMRLSQWQRHCNLNYVFNTAILVIRKHRVLDYTIVANYRA